jgi:hypothetical protein
MLWVLPMGWVMSIVIKQGWEMKQKIGKAQTMQNSFKSATLARNLRKKPDFGCDFENFLFFYQICFRLGRTFIKPGQNPPLVLYERRTEKLQVKSH